MLSESRRGLESDSQTYPHVVQEGVMTDDQGLCIVLRCRGHLCCVEVPDAVAAIGSCRSGWWWHGTCPGGLRPPAPHPYKCLHIEVPTDTS